MRQLGVLFLCVFWVTDAGPFLKKDIKSSNQRRALEQVIETLWLWQRDLYQSHYRCTAVGHVLNHSRDHFVNHHQSHRGHTHQNTFQNQSQNPLRPIIEQLCATQKVSQKSGCRVTLRAMRRQRMDPKHVRDYFHKYALFTRVFHLFVEGIWWLITRGWRSTFGKTWYLLKRTLPHSFKVVESERRQHSFIVGRTGAGKSVLLQHLSRHYLTRDKRPTLVVLDPHGDLARDLARDKALQSDDRLAYLKLGKVGGRHVQLNPFELRNTDEVALNRAQLQFAGAMEQVIGEDFTPRQRTLIRACVGVVLHRPGSTLSDLVRLLQDGQNADLVRYGREQLPNPVDRQFFTHSFAEPGYRATKAALVSRLTDILRDPVVRQFTGHPSSLDLSALLDAGKVIIVRFNPAQQGQDTIRAIGQLLNAAVLSHVLGRPASRRHPVHVHLDECQYFVSPTLADILGEGRKFGLYLTLATQRLESLDGKLQDAILGNVGTIWVGGSRHVTAEKVSKETNISADKIRHLPPLTFYQVVGHQKPKLQRLRYLGSRFAMKPGAWLKQKETQIKRFYTCAKRDQSPLPQHNFLPDFLDAS